MIKVYPSESRFQVENEWLSSKLSFSFGAYFDSSNTAFSVMRVCNEDEVAPGRGFGAHPHSDMEIVTIVLKGAVRHEDNLGNTEITNVGEVQRMSGGSGIIHAEYNASDKESTRFLQLWFMPNQNGLQPSYETSRYDSDSMQNSLHAIVTPDGINNTAKIHQDLTIYLSRIEKGKHVSYHSGKRKAFLFIIEGQLFANDSKLQSGDTARIESVTDLDLRADEDTFVMLIDLP
jgi:redox-sensitive bicupin YhaK (pirin superfamily)